MSAPAAPFADRLAEACRRKRSVVCVGLDPRPDRLPPLYGQTPQPAASVAFCLGILDAVADVAVAVKPNIAFFEALGALGVPAYAEVCSAARARGLLVIGDVKRGDIGPTAEAYAAGLLEDGPGAIGPHDAITVNAFLGSDGVQPFVDRAAANGKGVYLLVKTSNPSSAELQDLPLRDGGTPAEALARLVDTWGTPTVGAEGWSAVGAVVGATHGDELARFRARMPRTPFLLPGYGAQGAGADDVVGAFAAGGLGGLVNASRSVCFAFREPDGCDFVPAARAAAEAMRNDLNRALDAAGVGLPAPDA